MSEPMFLTLNEVIERYRGQVSDGTLRNWRQQSRPLTTFWLQMPLRRGQPPKDSVGCFVG
jgi:hypothetical protein